MEKTVQMNIGNKNSASKSVFKFDDVFIEVGNLCKYLGIYVDSKLSFQSHIEYIKKNSQNSVVLFVSCVTMYPENS